MTSTAHTTSTRTPSARTGGTRARDLRAPGRGDRPAAVAPGVLHAVLEDAVAEAVRRARRAADRAYGRGCGLPTVDVTDVLRAARDSTGLPVPRAEAAAALRAYLETRVPLDVRTDAYLGHRGPDEAASAVTAR
ncbi:hypothetical protein FM076_02655 [Streptomyces albus subsp. chlorinus]|uniref:hypothetical protein n=1 Tax=Streptomyces albus TaxID=1888 RepID=UPI00156E0781|nr:hypothetical protein [Streptomyces albus]NSC20168.1 hypothetical protein [Streptomyces albus subsp. chlorinus]